MPSTVMPVNIKVPETITGRWSLLAIDPGASTGIARFIYIPGNRLQVVTRTVLWPADAAMVLRDYVRGADVTALELYHLFPFKSAAQAWVTPPSALVQGFIEGLCTIGDRPLFLYQPAQTKSISDDFLGKYIPLLPTGKKHKHERDAIRVGVLWMLKNWSYNDQASG
jgi:hypothetical protein